MHKVGVFMAAVALLFVAPVLAQEMGGATGPGSSRGLEPTYNNGYDRGGPVRAEVGALNRINSYAMSPDNGHCAQRHPSYDPASGTDKGHDERRHSCR